MEEMSIFRAATHHASRLGRALETECSKPKCLKEGHLQEAKVKESWNFQERKSHFTDVRMSSSHFWFPWKCKLTSLTFTRERERERENCSARTQSWWRPRKRWTQGPELSRHVHISFISFHFTSLASKTCTPKFYPFVSQFSKGNAIGNLFQRPYINATLKSHLGDIRSNQTGSALICSEKNHPMIEICPFKKRWANDVSN